MTTARTAPITIENVPQELRERSQWVLWRIVERDGEKTKVPLQLSGKGARANDPSTWTTFDAVLPLAHRHDGIGYEFSADDPYCGIDLDGCRNPSDGTIEPWAKQIILDFATYAEVSPSGTGVKLFCRGKLPFDRGRNVKLNEEKICDKAPGVEVYDHGRYFAVTGWRLAGQPHEPQDRQAAIDALCHQYFPARQAAPKPSSNGHPARSTVKERCRKYVAEIDGAVSGNGGHNATYHVCCILARFGLAYGDALEVLLEYNERCSPPWTEPDLEHKLRDAFAEVEAAGELGIMAESRNGSAPKRKAELEQGDNVTLKRGNQADYLTLLEVVDIRTAAGRTEMATATLFNSQHGDKVRWCDPWLKWLVWDRTRWKIDDGRHVEALAKETAESIWSAVGAILPDVPAATGAEMVGFAKRTASRRGIDAMLALARSEQGIPILPAALDSHPWLLNFQNGTVDLKTAQRRPHDPSLYLTKIVPFAYLPEAECPLWSAFLNRIFADLAPMIQFVRRLFGMAIVGEVFDHVLPILWGRGANGKSVLLETIMYALGDDYSGKAAPDLLMAKRQRAHPTELADLHGKRLIAAVESDDGQRLAESQVKELSGGDTIKARRMNEDFWQFRPSHTAVMVTNHKPEVRGTDNGIWRRLRLVPFTVTIPLDEQDTHLADKLKAEASGILTWLVGGCLAWQRMGLAEPDDVLAATREYRDQMDVLAEFLTEACLFGPVYKVKASVLYAAYLKWCEARGEKPKSSRGFGEAMTEREYERKTSNGVWYIGIGLRE